MRRTLRPLVLIVLPLLTALALVSTDSRGFGRHSPMAEAATLESDSYVQQMLALLNQERWAAGVPQLTLGSDISAAADARALDMASNHYFAHISPSGVGPVETLMRFGIPFRLMGENIAESTELPGQVVQVVHSALMASNGHRANMLDPRFSRVGIAVASEGGTFYFVEVFLD